MMPPGPPPLPGAGGGGRGPHAPFHFGRVHGHAGPVSVSTGAGAGPIAVGAGLWGVGHIMHQAQEPLHQAASLRLLGLSDQEITQVLQQARQTATAVPGSGFSENVKTIGEMYSVVGLQHSLELSQKMATLDRVMALTGKGREEGSGYILSRAGELMGKLSDPNDLRQFESTLDIMARVGIATHGKVTPQEWLNYAKQAGPAAGTLTGEGFYTTAAIIQAIGGFRAGTAAQALQRQFAGGVMTKSKADELKALGIFQEGDYTVERGGHVQFRTDAARGFVERLQHDPLAAIVDVLEPAMERKGFTRLEDQTREIYKIIGTGPAQREVFELLRGHAQIVQERERAKGALSPEAALGTANLNDPIQSMAAFTKSFNDMLGALGGPLMQAAVPVLNTLTSAFNSIAAAAGGHKTAAATAGGIAAGAATGAGIGLGIGWLGGPFGAGAGALMGGIAGGAIGLGGSLSAQTRQNMWAGGLHGAALAPGPLAPFGFMGGALAGAFPSLLPNGIVGSAQAAAAPTTQVKAEITVKAETDRPQTLAEMILAEINKLISAGHLHNLSEADSIHNSPYVTGVGGP